ncbi:hypothetical protein AB0M22_39600 [Nocardia sp. NPDC051756]|uniref:hypothetical protein n=1 Tax=Nocardia sp. NPDC051756 TaxID=3154751 RepID=UPI003448F0A5
MAELLPAGDRPWTDAVTAMAHGLRVTLLAHPATSGTLATPAGQLARRRRFVVGG